MSVDVSCERMCYVHCNLCNTILAVSVPYSNMFNIVTVRCGHCAYLLSVNMSSMIQTFPFQDFQHQNFSSQDSDKECGSSSKTNKMLDSTEDDQPRILPIRPPEKRQRVPSAYNKFIKEEIQRIKASNPDISHREAFSTAAKNWAHFPHIHFGLTIDGNKQVKVDEPFAGEGAQKTQGFY
ncbi:putative axial regulator YABBY 2 isoform X4 [Cinnamomum micranthum f. kanehirae]|uniref:Putative axial regulator YABBY 2 isoform X4 n=1 Tax=Cinnamomum micranthum f. kanehirae TaxID=337451 RepID=A0A443NPA5_9MAGN|nr:putative axial regulator YABBY 2 isoform X4 [Cinnamomum micranthum f. kanehirae]